MGADDKAYLRLPADALGISRDAMLALHAKIYGGS
jgi:hypothetical protein